MPNWKPASGVTATDAVPTEMPSTTEIKYAIKTTVRDAKLRAQLLTLSYKAFNYRHLDKWLFHEKHFIFLGQRRWLLLLCRHCTWFL